MLPEISAITTALKNAKDLIEEIASKVKERADSALTERFNKLLFLIMDLSTSVISFQGYILSLQKKLLSLQEEIEALQKENAQLKNNIESAEKWKEESKLYEPCELFPGVWVYSPKDKDQKGPRLCPNCFQEKRISFLQLRKHKDKGIYYACSNCSFEVMKPSAGPVMAVSKGKREPWHEY